MNIVHSINRRFKINRTVRELSALSNSMLSDIGIDRSSIHHVAEAMVDAGAARISNIRLSDYHRAPITEPTHRPVAA